MAEAPPKSDAEVLREVHAKLERLERIVERLLELPIVRMWLRGVKL